MKRVNLLLGNSEELVNDLIEATVQEVCAGRAEVKAVRTGELADFIQQGCEAAFDLAILIPNNLSSDLAADSAGSAMGKGVEAIQAIKSHSATPVIALPVFEARTTEEPLMLGAGADRVLELPFDRDELKMAVSGLLKLPARPEPSSGFRFFASVPPDQAFATAGVPKDRPAAGGLSGSTTARAGGVNA